MKKATKGTKKTAVATKSFFRSAGETIGSIAHELVEGKNKLVETASAEFASIKKAVSKRLKKKKPAVAKKKARPAVKKAAKKSVVAASRAKPRKAAAKKPTGAKKSKTGKPKR